MHPIRILTAFFERFTSLTTPTDGPALTYHTGPHGTVHATRPPTLGHGKRPADTKSMWDLNPTSPNTMNDHRPSGHRHTSVRSAPVARHREHPVGAAAG